MTGARFCPRPPPRSWNAIDLYILEGDVVGHRRWILYPQTREMGTGDIPAVAGYPATNDLWVFDRDHMWGPRPATRDGFVTWPPPGYVPYQVVNAFWSFGYPQADFSSTTITVTSGGATVPVQVQPIANGYGENTLVYKLPPLPPRSATDVAYHVELRHVLVGGSARDYAYDVVLFDPTR